MSQKKSYKKYPSAKEPCICGSGKKFKRCCGPRIENLPDGWGYLNSGRSQIEILKIARAKFTRYVIWYRSHTVPLLDIDREKSALLLEVDSNALGELLSHIRIAHHGHPRSPDFQQVLDHTENLLDTKRWEEHHQKQQFIFYLEEPADEASCRRFASEVDVHEVTDPGFLAIILGYREDLSIAERLGIIDQIADRSTDWELKVQFLCYKGLLWELHGDSKEAKKICWLQQMLYLMTESLSGDTSLLLRHSL